MSCSRTQHSDLKPRAPQLRVKHSTTEPLRSLCSNENFLKMHVIDFFCVTHENCTKYETCAKSHRFHIFCISHSLTSLKRNGKVNLCLNRHRQYLDFGNTWSKCYLVFRAILFQIFLGIRVIQDYLNKEQFYLCSYCLLWMLPDYSSRLPWRQTYLDVRSEI